MKVYLAGYNVDTNVLNEILTKIGKRDDLTPEVISAAYARISRDPRPINEIRMDAKTEVERSRRSNSTIIFKMGHHSVAEHAVFNLDILGVSRYAMEEVEKFRLCSYTEKSQRYITLDNDFVIPEEIKNTSLEKAFIEMIQEQNKAYFTLFELLKKHTFKKHASLAADPKNHNLLEGWAKEDARYVTSLATESQVGITINARNLELMLRRFASHPLAEIKSLGQVIYDRIVTVAPSIVLFHQANDYDCSTYSQLREMVHSLVDKESIPELRESPNEVELMEYTQDADSILIATLLHVSSNLPYIQCRTLAQKLSTEEREKICTTTWKNMQFYDSVLREFEYVNLTYNIVLSSACFGQLKRHRMSSQSYQSYDPGLGVTVPGTIYEIGYDKYFMEITDKSTAIFTQIAKVAPAAAPYILTNAHRKRVLLRLNARELYHMARLREDKHAQWDIRNVSAAMSKQAKEVMPLVCSILGGKDKYKEMYHVIFGKDPKVTEAILPGTRKIVSE